MRIDVIIASRNGAAKLARSLPQQPLASMARHGTKLILVDSGSDDGTLAVMRRFAAEAAADVVVDRVARPGKALAQELGLTHSDADVVAFTDDDCTLAPDYLDRLLALYDDTRFQYGAGEVIVTHADADPRVANTAWWSHRGALLLPPNSMVAPGVAHGANMFFGRHVLERIRRVGPQPSALQSDVMAFYQASAAGFTGALLEGLKVHHEHGRRRGSREADATSRDYDRTRGAYFAQVIAAGDLRAFDVWEASVDPAADNGGRIAREFAAGALALADRLASDGLPAPAAAPLVPAAAPASDDATGEKAPELSIVIATRDRHALLREAIRSIEAQSLDAGRFELIVIDNSSDLAAQAAFVRDLAVDCRCDYAIETQPGAARARNIGTRLAKGGIVAFLDDDAVADPGWAAAILHRFAADPAIGVLGGPVAPIWPGGRPAWLPTDMDPLLTVLDHGPEPHRLKPHEWLVGANMAFRKAALTAAGGLPENLGRRGAALLSNEDLAALRGVVAAGHIAFYDPRMRVRHQVHADRLTQGWLRRRVAWQVVSDLLETGDAAPAVPWPPRTRGEAGDSFAALSTECRDATEVAAQLQAIERLMRMILSEHGAPP